MLISWKKRRKGWTWLEKKEKTNKTAGFHDYLVNNKQSVQSHRTSFTMTTSFTSSDETGERRKCVTSQVCEEMKKCNTLKFSCFISSSSCEFWCLLLLSFFYDVKKAAAGLRTHSIYCPKWISTRTINFCHYSVWDRHCVEIQTSSGRDNKLKGMRKRKTVKPLWQHPTESDQACKEESVNRTGCSSSNGSYLSWNCLDGIRPARGLASPSCLACHHVASSWLMIWRMEPFLKSSPASLHGMELSFLGS